VNWGKLPDFAAVLLLASAFASVARRSRAPVSVSWLTGWLMIALHFAATTVVPTAGLAGQTASFVGVVSLAWAGILFSWATVPYRRQISSHWMLMSMLSSTAVYIGVIVFSSNPPWALNSAAILFGAGPLGIALFKVRTEGHPLRWMTVATYCSLSAFLLVFQNRPGNGLDLAINAILFNVYLGCCVHFLFAYRRASAGAFVTMAGFLAWASVFVVAPWIASYWPNAPIENEVWNLPKYLVAVGMILLLLEDQIEHNKYLALHDELTGLPNRRLFQDRLNSALERARRTGSQTALLLVDLDQFKQVNDTYGHHAGDLLLEHVGKVFSGRVRRSDTVARTGGDEFAIVLDEPTSRADAERVSNSLLELLNEPLQLGERTIRIGASIGIALFPEDAAGAEELCIAADLRMYEFKHRNGIPPPPPRRPQPQPVLPFPVVESSARLQRAE
jgi:diguanylate cyclase (GGDEF)-like protein